MTDTAPPPAPDLPVLAVDLDGTLLASDMLFETFWSALSLKPLAVPGMMSGAGGKAGLKRRLAEASDVDVTRLPYDADVIQEIERWRAQGGRTALVTATDEVLAQAIADHLGIFDEVHGSDGTRNLKGEAKAAFLVEHFGAGGFAYMGDSKADLEVWPQAAHIFTVNAGSDVQSSADGLGPPVTHLETRDDGLKPMIRALRPHQWLKNVLIFVPILAAHAFTTETILQSILAFIAFSLTASSVYVMNDLLDLSADRAHPRKRNRPLAAGTLPIEVGTVLVGALLFIGLIIALMLGWPFVLALVIYYIVTTAYSLYLKRRTIVDIWILASLYTMRILAGAAATAIVPSVWLMAFSIFFFFSLAAVKRQAELVELSETDELGARRRGYNRDDVLLIAMMAISSGYVSILVMALYVRTPFVSNLYGFPPLLLGICLVLLYWISRVVLMTHRGHMHDDPIVFALKDNVSRVCLVAIFALAILSAVL